MRASKFFGERVHAKSRARFGLSWRERKGKQGFRRGGERDARRFQTFRKKG